MEVMHEEEGAEGFHSLLQDRQTGYVQAVRAHVSLAACHKIRHYLRFSITIFRRGYLADIRQCEELWEELQFLFHGH